jgi:hypothetical protein
LNKIFSNSRKKSTIDKLADKLDAFESKYRNSVDYNDGINYWRGKRIIPLAEWKEIVNYNEAFQHGIEYQNTREALQYFPGDYQRFPLFPLGVEKELIPATNIWWKQYIELMEFTKNPTYLAKIARARGVVKEGEYDELDYEWDDDDEGEEQDDGEQQQQQETTSN